MPPAAVPKKKSPASNKTASPSGLSGFRRVQIGFNVIVQIVVMAFIVLIVNAIAFKHFKRFDFSHDNKYALTQRTKQFLAGMSKPVKLIVFMSDTNSPVLNVIKRDVSNLVEEYRNAQSKFISIEMIDPFRNAGRAGEIQAKYKLLGAQENVLIADCEGRQKIVSADKMVDLDEGNPMFGQPPQVTAFKGEETITGALIEVTEGKKSAAYYLRGHGEPDIKAAGSPLALVGKLLESEHVDLQELNLLNVESVPAEASTLMIFGPAYDLTEREAKLLDDYWAKGGRLLVLLNPDAQTPRLSEFLGRVGIRPEDDRILRTLNIAGMPTVGLVRDAYSEFTGPGPIAKELAGVNQIFVGATQSLTLNPDAVRAQNIKVEPLLQAIKGFWGETDYKSIEEGTAPTLDPDKDKQAPLFIAATVEKGAVGDQRVQVGAARMIVVGNARFVRADSMNEANANLFLSSLNWLLAREQLIGIAPKQAKTFTLNLPENQVQTIFWTATLAIPGFFALLGVLVWWRRRA
jgi:hypothetical protein